MDHQIVEVYDQMFLKRKKGNPSAVLLSYWEHHFSSETFISEQSIFGHVLDLGCGTGEIDIWLARKKNEVEIDAVDFSGTALEIFREHLEKEENHISSRITIHQASISDLPFPDSHFDCCLISHTLEHIEDHTPVFNEIYRCLKPGGTVIAIVPKEHFHDDPTHVWHFSPRSYKEHLELFGIVEKIWESPSHQEIAARIRLWPKPKIICMMRVKNEEEWLERAMKSVHPLVDGYVIFDDGSTDRTPEICKLNPKIRQYYYNAETIKDESGNKNKLLAMSLAENPDWILALDGDEVLENAGPIAILREVSLNQKEITAIGFQFPYLWDNPGRYRVDGPYWDIRHPRLFRITELECNPNMLFFGDTSHGGNNHCGSIPSNLPGATKYLDVCIKHYGYFDKERREKKRKSYEEIDPEYAAQGFYQHLTEENNILFHPWNERKQEVILHYDRQPKIIVDFLKENNNSLPLSGMFYLPGAESHLDIGSNTGASLNGLDPTSLYCIEKFPLAVGELRKKGYKVFEGDARQIIDRLLQEGRTFDRVTAYDFIEHLPKQDGVSFLEKIERVARREIIFFVPIETRELTESNAYKSFMESVYEQIPIHQRELQTHQAQWSPAEFQEMGYDILFISDFHFKGFNAFFAFKYKRNTDREIGLFNIHNFLNKSLLKNTKAVTSACLASIKNPILLTNPERIITGKDVSIRDGARIEAITDYGNEIYDSIAIIDDGCHIEFQFHLGSANFVYIGKKVMIANRVSILDHDHGYEDVGISTMDQPLNTGEVIIDDDVWIGENVVICKNVYLGKHSVIGANSVVTRPIPPYCVAAGNPARILKRYDFQAGAWIKYGKNNEGQDQKFIEELKQKAYEIRLQYEGVKTAEIYPSSQFQIPEKGSRGLMIRMNLTHLVQENDELPADGSQNLIRFSAGFHNDEGGWRWMSGEGQIIVPTTLLKEKTHFSLKLTCGDQKYYSKFPFDVELYDHQKLFGTYNFSKTGQYFYIQIPITEPGSDLKVRLISNSVFVPLLAGISQDMRQLSVHVSELELINMLDHKADNPFDQIRDPEVENQIFKANQAVENGDLQQAFNILNSEEKKEPTLQKRPFYQVLLASVMIQLGYLAQAEQKLLIARLDEPANPQIYNLLGVIKYLHEDVPSAKMYFQSALNLDPGFENARQNLELISKDQHNS